MNDMLAIFYGHVYFIEENERFNFGGEDLENSKFLKIWKFLTFYCFITPNFTTLEVLNI